MGLLIGIHIFVCAFLVFVILLQPGKADGGITFGGSSSQSIFGSKGAGNFLTKTTSVCAILFLITSFFLTRERSKEYTGSVIGKEPVQEAPKTMTPPAAATPENKPVETKAEAAKPAEAPKK